MLQAFLRSGAGGSSHGGAVATKASRSEELPVHMPLAKEGYLYKRGGSHGGRANWKRRWFMLMGDVLYYMESHSDRTPRGRVVLKGCDFRNAEADCKRPHAFGIYHLHDMTEVPFFCSSDSAQDTADWLVALAEAAHGRFRVRTRLNSRCPRPTLRSPRLTLRST